MCSVQCASCSVQSSVFSVQFVMFSVKWAVCIVQYTVWSVQCAVCRLQCAQSNERVLPTQFDALEHKGLCPFNLAQDVCQLSQDCTECILKVPSHLIPLLHSPTHIAELKSNKAQVELSEKALDSDVGAKQRLSKKCIRYRHWSWQKIGPPPPLLPCPLVFCLCQ